MISIKRIFPFLTIILSIIIVFAFSTSPTGKEQKVVNRIVINIDLGKETIGKNIYGHFSEHLGRCIYEGFWVGEKSPIKNTRGIRNIPTKISRCAGN